MLFEIDQLADPDHKLVPATTRLYDNGAFETRVIDVDRKPMRAVTGCLDAVAHGRARVDDLRGELDAAPW